MDGVWPKERRSRVGIPSTHVSGRPSSHAVTDRSGTTQTGPMHALRDTVVAWRTCPAAMRCFEGRPHISPFPHGQSRDNPHRKRRENDVKRYRRCELQPRSQQRYPMPWSSYCPQRMPSLVSDDPLTHRLTPSPIWGMGGLLTNERVIWGHTQAVDCCQCRNAWTEQASAMPVSLAKTWAGEALEALGDHGVWCLRSDHDDHH